MNYVDPTGHMPWDAKKILQQYQSEIAASASKYGVDPTVVAAVLYNENRIRFFVHDAKDFVGELNSLLGPGDVSLGLGQMTVSTALYLDLGPGLASSGAEFDKAKFAVLEATDQGTRMDYMGRLKDPATNIDYVAKYLGYLQKAGNFDSPEKLLDAYNNNTWTDDPTAYGQRYQTILGILQDLGITFSSGASSGPVQSLGGATRAE